MKPPRDRRPGSLPPPTTYDVGYGKPPVHSQFQKGTSGNPKGRPKGAKARRSAPDLQRLRGIILEEAYRMIAVRDGVREVKVPMAQAVVRALAVNAVKGQQRAQRLFTELLTTTEREKRRERYERLESLLDYKRTWDRELARRAQFGIIAPDPVPHPDDIRIDFWRGTFEISGPISKEDKADLEVWRRYRQIMVVGNEGLAMLLAEGPDASSPEEIEDMEEQMRGNQQCIDLIDGMLRTGRPMPLPDLPEEFALELDDPRQDKRADTIEN
jgi:hypothetical protein